MARKRLPHMKCSCPLKFVQKYTWLFQKTYLGNTSIAEISGSLAGRDGCGARNGAGNEKGGNNSKSGSLHFGVVQI
jgi:hypothetical protein